MRSSSKLTPQAWTTLLGLVLLSAFLAMPRTPQPRPAASSPPAAPTITQPSNTTPSSDPIQAAMPLVFWSLASIVGLGCAYVLFTEIRLQRRLSALHAQPVIPDYCPTPEALLKNRQPQPSRTGFKQRPIRMSISARQWRLHSELLVLVRKDEAAAKRLLRSVALQHPNRDLDWCYEKVIWDLERDRRAL